jgi:capsular exopolysaccharide synthesis family protein
MSKRPTATNQAAAKHWTLAIEPITSIANAETAGASSIVVPGWLPRVEPELVRSSLSDSSEITVPALPQVDAELVRSTDDSFTPATGCRHSVESEVLDGSNGDSHGLEIAVSAPAEPETINAANAEPALVMADPLPPTETETFGASNTETAAVAADSSLLTEPETTSTPNAELNATENSTPLPEHETNGSSGPQPAAVTAHSLPLIEPETIGTPSAQPPAISTDSLSLAAPQVQSSISPLSRSQAALSTTEWSSPKTLEPSRDFESTNGYRHLTLSANEDSRLVFQTEPNGLAAEQFRLLRRTLAREFESGAVLLITSPAMGDGKTLTSVNLASCLAESGQPTLLVEADIRRPTIRRVLGANVEPPGVEDVLARNVEPRRAVHGIKELNLYAAMVTKIPYNPAQLIGGPGVKQLLAWARENFLWIVLDAPPTLPAADVSELLPFADAALLVVRAQSTPRELAKQSVEILGKQLRGVIFNEVTVDSNPHYRYLNNYYYPQTSDSKSGGGRLVKRTKPV